MTNTTILVIGGGPAGIEAAREAAAAGASVTLISNAPIGGRAGWHSLLPSKVWLHAADTLGRSHGANQIGLGVSTVQPDTGAILRRIKNVAQAWNEAQAESLRAAGVTVCQGTAVFQDAHTLVVQDKDGSVTQTLRGDAVIIAAGSVPRFPVDLKPDGRRVIAPRFAGHLESLPQTAVVIGGGATGSEFAYLLNRLGTAVTWIVDAQGILPSFQTAAGAFLGAALVHQGVELVPNQTAVRIERGETGVTVVTDKDLMYQAQLAFVAIGRSPDVTGLNLDAAGISLVNGAPLVDAYGRCPDSSVYVVGDAGGAPMIANRALTQARVAARHAAGVAVAPYRPETVVAATYTDPQVAQVGRVEGSAITSVQVPFNASLKGELLAEHEGYLQLAYEEGNGRVCGAVAVGPHAADVLAPVAVAIQQQAVVQDLAAIYPAYPTLSELPFAAARLAVR